MRPARSPANKYVVPNVSVAFTATVASSSNGLSMPMCSSGKTRNGQKRLRAAVDPVEVSATTHVTDTDTDSGNRENSFSKNEELTAAALNGTKSATGKEKTAETTTITAATRPELTNQILENENLHPALGSITDDNGEEDKIDAPNKMENHEDASSSHRTVKITLKSRAFITPMEITAVVSPAVLALPLSEILKTHTFKSRKTPPKPRKTPPKPRNIRPRQMNLEDDFIPENADEEYNNAVAGVNNTLTISSRSPRKAKTKATWWLYCEFAKKAAINSLDLKRKRIFQKSSTNCPNEDPVNLRKKAKTTATRKFASIAEQSPPDSMAPGSGMESFNKPQEGPHDMAKLKVTVRGIDEFVSTVAKCHLSKIGEVSVLKSANRRGRRQKINLGNQESCDVKTSTVNTRPGRKCKTTKLSGLKRETRTTKVTRLMKTRHQSLTSREEDCSSDKTPTSNRKRNLRSRSKLLSNADKKKNLESFKEDRCGSNDCGSEGGSEIESGSENNNESESESSSGAETATDTATSTLDFAACFDSSSENNSDDDYSGSDISERSTFETQGDETNSVASLPLQLKKKTRGRPKRANNKGKLVSKRTSNHKNIEKGAKKNQSMNNRSKRVKKQFTTNENAEISPEGGKKDISEPRSKSGIHSSDADNHCILDPCALVKHYRDQYNFYGVCLPVDFGWLPNEFSKVPKKWDKAQVCEKVKNCIDTALSGLNLYDASQNKEEYTREDKIYTSCIRKYQGMMHAERIDKQREKEEYDLKLREYSYYNRTKRTQADNELDEFESRPIQFQSKCTQSISLRSSSQILPCTTKDCCICCECQNLQDSDQQREQQHRKQQWQQQQKQVPSEAFVPLPRFCEISLSDPEFMRRANDDDDENDTLKDNRKFPKRKGKAGNTANGVRGSKRNSDGFRRRAIRGGCAKYETSVQLQEMKNSLQFIEDYDEGMLPHDS